MNTSIAESVESSSSEQEKRVLREHLRTLRGIRCGSVVLTVHDGCVVEIHRTEKIRMAGPKDP